jgi:transcriptional regulator with XRE-family HTH domain
MNKLRTFRQTHKISQAELAKVLNTTQQQISLYETGRTVLTFYIQTVILNERNKIIDLERIKQSEKGTRLFLAGSLFFCNYFKLYPTRTQKTDAKANKQQSKAPSRESDIG